MQFVKHGSTKTRMLTTIVPRHIQFLDCVLDCDPDQYLGYDLDCYIGQVLDGNLDHILYFETHKYLAI